MNASLVQGKQAENFKQVCKYAIVIPAKAGIHSVDSHFCRNDRKVEMMG